jgi:hypothetical protein
MLPKAAGAAIYTGCHAQLTLATVLRLFLLGDPVASLGSKPRRKTMFRVALIILALTATIASAFSAERPTRFWNLIHNTISEFQLAPAGTTKWGENQCKNDKDGTVDFDERLRITGIESGRYDARIKDVSGRVCFARNVNIKAGEVFSIEERDLADCSR